MDYKAKETLQGAAFSHGFCDANLGDVFFAKESHWQILKTKQQ